MKTGRERIMQKVFLPVFAPWQSAAGAPIDH
jgi:hypothetical protein